MKKYERVNLASEIYKQPSHSKSPIHNALMQLNPNVKKVCCPNCRYYFTVSFQDLLNKLKKNETPTKYKVAKEINYFEQSMKIKKSVTGKSMQTQTEAYLNGQYKVSPKRQKVSNTLSGIMTDRTPERNIQSLFSPRDKQKNKNALLSQRKFQINTFQDSFFGEKSKYQDTSVGKKINSSIKSLIKKTQYPMRSAYMQAALTSARNVTPNKQFSKKRLLSPSSKSQQKQVKFIAKQDSKPSPISKIITPQKQQNTKTLKSLKPEKKSKSNSQLNQQKVQFHRQISEIITYQIDLLPQVNIPSYCKMLAFDIKNKISQSQQKQNQQNSIQPSTHKLQYLNKYQIQPDDQSPRFTIRTETETRVYDIS